MRRFSIALTASIALGASCAQATTIYYHCAAGICRIAPDGSGQQTVASGDYRSPSVSLDGAHLAWVQSTADLFTGDGTAGSPVGPITRFAVYAVISPDGTKVLTFEGAGQPTRVCIYDVAGGSCDGQGGGAITSADWAPGNRVMIATRESGDPAFAQHNHDYNNEICLLKPSGGATGGECESTLVRDADYELDDPALSPDGKTLAVSRAPWDHQDQGQIALYDVASGALKTVLTSGPGDETPFWSPDGSQIAFSRGGGIYVVSASGTAGSEKRIADGNSPTWSDTGGGGAAVKATAPRTQKGTRVRGTYTAPAGASVEIDVVVQGFIVGRKIIASAPGGRRAFAVALQAKVVKALRAHHVHRVPATVVVRAGGTAVKRKVTLRL